MTVCDECCQKLHLTPAEPKVLGECTAPCDNRPRGVCGKTTWCTVVA